jgi:hypothetical protein
MTPAGLALKCMEAVKLLLKIVAVFKPGVRGFVVPGLYKKCGQNIVMNPDRVCVRGGAILVICNSTV